MKQKITLSLIALFCAVFSANAVIQITGYTVWTSTAITDDIEILSGGTLDIQNLNVDVLAGKQIYVRDGGRIFGNNGSLSCSNGLWSGIEMEPTDVNNPHTQIAVQLFNFELANAEIAIQSTSYTSGFHNQQISLISVDFIDNDMHLSVSNTTTSSSNVPLLLNELSQMTYSTVYALRCNFWETNSGGNDVWMNCTYRPKFVECYFGGNPGQIGMCIYWKDCYKGLISDSEFREDRQAYILLEGFGSVDIRIHDNYFHLYDVGDFRAAIFAPLYGNSTAVFKNLFIADNIFSSGSFSQFATGFHFGDYTSNPNPEYENLTISGNEFYNIQYGVNLERSAGSDNIISSNLFSNCQVGCYFREDNLGVKIECNTFENNITDIHITDGAELENQNWSIDNGNTWSVVTSPNVNILNDGSVNFEYHYNANLPIAQGPVTLLAVASTNECDGDGGGSSSSMNTNLTYSREQRPTTISMSPNPATNVVSYTISDDTIDEIVVTSLTGEIALKMNVSGMSSGRLDVSKLKAGMYLCNYINQAGTQYQEKLIIVD